MYGDYLFHRPVGRVSQVVCYDSFSNGVYMILRIILFGLGLLAPFMVSALESEKGSWERIFNGENFDGWYTYLDGQGKNKDPDRIFQVYDGVIHIYKNNQHGQSAAFGYLSTISEYSNYHLRFQYRWGNKKFGHRTNAKRDAGVLYHVVGKDKLWPTSVESQIQEGDTGDIFTIATRISTTIDPVKESSGKISYYQVGGVAHTQGSKGITRVVKSGMYEKDGWNTVEIVVQGSNAVHIVNGKINNRCEEIHMSIPSVLSNWLPLLSWDPLDKGKIAFQAEGAEIFYRNIEIKSLDIP